MYGDIKLMTTKITRDGYVHEYHQVGHMLNKNREAKRN